MLSIDEAIAFERQQAKDKRNEHYTFGIQKSKEAAEEHEQLAEWLEELKAFKENKWTDIYIKRGYNNGIDMEEVITLKQLSNVQNWIGKGVRIAFCLDEYSSVTNKIDLINFKQIKEQISNPEKFRIFRIDSSDDLICVYVIEIAEKGVNINGHNDRSNKLFTE